MKKEVLSQILLHAKENEPTATEEEIVKMVEMTEERLSKELTGFALEDRPYEQFYSQNALHRVYPSVKISQLVLEKIIKAKDKVQMKCGRDIKNDEFLDKILTCVSSLKEHGLKKGDFITVCAPTSPELIYLFMAANILDITIRFIDPISSKNEIKANVLTTNSKMLFVLDLSYSSIKGIEEGTNLEKIIGIPLAQSLPLGTDLTKLKVMFGSKVTELMMKKEKELSGKWETWKKFESKKPATLKEVTTHLKDYDHDVISAIFSTSGSTGEPRGVCIRNSEMVASVLKQIDADFRFDGTERFFNPMPSSSSYFWSDLIMCILNGVPYQLSPLFNPENSPKEMIKSRCSVILSGPILIDMFDKYLIEQKRKGKKIDISHIKHVVSGGDLLELELEHRANRTFREFGSEAIIENVLGTSEKMGPAMVPNGVLRDKSAYREGSVGIILPGDTMGIFKYDTENNTRNIHSEDYNQGLLYYEIGEICYKADDPTVFTKYFKNPESTAATLLTHTDGSVWYHTGDLGFMDPCGRTYTTCRKSGLIVRAGHKVWAPKIEKIMKMFNGVKEVKVIGVNDEIEKEVPVAFIVFEENITDEETKKIKEDMLAQISITIDQLHVPVEVIQIKELPRNIMTKVKVGDLKHTYEEHKKLVLEKKSI